MKSPHLAVLLQAHKAPSSSEDATTGAKNESEDAGHGEDASAHETPDNEGMSDAEAHHHGRVNYHLGMAEKAHKKGKHKAVGVHLKLAAHHHAQAMTEAGLNDEEMHESGGGQETTPGGQPEAETEMGEEDE